MANPFELLKAKVSATNDVLKRKKVGVTIYIKKDAFALRASLPSKDGQSNQNIQQWVSIGLKADQKNIKEAVRLSEKLGEEKRAGLFKWSDWEKKNEEPVEILKESRKVGDIIKRFEKDFWSAEDKDKNNNQNMAGWKQIEGYLLKMEKHKILNYENIVELANKAPAGSKKKADTAKHFLRLAKFAEIPNLRKLQEWSTATQKAYKDDAKKRSRKRLKDEEYLYHVRLLREDPIWGWALAAQFVFGTRTSEIWSIKPFEESGKIMAEVLTVPKSEEPSEWRVTPALKQEWARTLDILNIYREFSIDKTEDYDSAFLKSLNRRFTKWLAKKTNHSFQAYDLRHAYGYRTANMNINTASASKFMGHSEAVHTATYQKGYDKQDVLKTLNLLAQQQQ
tara:strand:- start:13674 stop:14855 length:1182 start_codon:yes stop_codon:yes gene_type:complete